MKRTAIFLILIITLSGCQSMYQGLVTNITNVELNQNNFTVVKTISGKSKCVEWLLLPFWCPTPNLLGEAKSDMLSTAGLQDGSKAIVNLRAEIDAKFYGVVFIKTMYVSAEVVEFID